MKPGAFITFDVECSMGGAWGDEALRPIPPSRGMMGLYGDRQLGLPLITRILEENGLAGTFFVEPFNDELGYPGQTEPVCTFLLDRGQDVQLHIHPNHKHYGQYRAGGPFARTDDIADLPAEAQRQMLAEGAARLAGYTGARPVAFRAGNMAASEETLEQLAAVGISLDSSYAFCYAGGQCRFAEKQPFNGSKWYGDVLELALSGFYQPRVPGLHHAKPLDLMGISFTECRDAICRILDAGVDAVLILHSFSLFKVRNVQYDGGRLNRIVTRRFRRLCRWLADRAADVPTYTFGQLASAIADGRYEAKASPPCRLGRPMRAITRKLVQGLNNAYWV